jgi:hypothetical protein
MMNDNMYFLDDSDEVKKYDGSNVYDSGLIRWQPALFCSIDTRVGSIVINKSEVEYSAADGNKFTCADSSTTAFQEGDRVADDDDGQIYTITGMSTEYLSGTDNDYVYVDRDITGGSGTKLTKVVTRSYYFRLNMFDANDNIIASAVTGLNDYVVELSDNCQVMMRLISPAVLRSLDYDRIEIEVYSTRTGALAPYYRNQVLVLGFDNTEGYIDIVDSAKDELLTDLDPVNSKLLGGEVGTAWEPPPRAKYIDSDNNRLVVGNVRGEPELNLNLFPLAGQTYFNEWIPDSSSASKLLVRKDNTDSGITSNMKDRVIFEFINNGPE